MKIDKVRIDKARRKHGVKPLPGRGRPAVGPAPKRPDLVRLYVKAGLSVRATARALNCSKDAVFKALSDYEIKTRPNVRASRLSPYGMAELRRRVKKDGLRATARALDVNPATLLEYIERHGRRK
jgi:transposase-like protein